MSGNIFTEELKNNLPIDIQSFITRQKLRLLFKDDLRLLYNKNLREKSMDPSLNAKESLKLKKERSNKLETILRSSCNPKFTKLEKNEFLEKNSCKKYYDRKNKEAQEKLADKEKADKEKTDKEKVFPLKYLPGIGDDYFEKVMANIDSPMYDIIIIINTESSKKRFDQSIVAFLITEKSECKDSEKIYTDIPALNLICVSSKNKNRYTSRLLLYVYLYALKKSNYRYGLLELAGSYCNLAGLCLYNKFGFREDISIKSKHCFPELGTLTMVADINRITYDSLEKAFTSERSENIDLPDSEPLCEKVQRTMTSKTQQDEVDVRMHNYDNILRLQNGDIKLDEFGDYFDKKTPTQLKKAIQDLSKYSKQGRYITPTPISAIPDYFFDKVVPTKVTKTVSTKIKSKNKNKSDTTPIKQPHKSIKRRKRKRAISIEIQKAPKNTTQKKNKHFS